MGQLFSSVYGESTTVETPHHSSGGYSPSFYDDARKREMDLQNRLRYEEAMILKKRRKKEIVWLKHYNSQQRMLLVGEGDFSFSASLAVAFGSSASNITATSLDSYQFLCRHYKNAISNIDKLTSRGASVVHELDATTMYTHHSSLMFTKFDRIIYNFPFYGFNRNETPENNLRNHRELVRKFLWNAKRMLSVDGEIHITHKTNKPHLKWYIKELAFSEGLSLVREVNFSLSDYPGYETKYGFGGDKNFDCNPSKTYMWRIAASSCLYN